MVKTYILYCDALKDKSLFEKYYQEMPQARKEKINSYFPDVDKRLSLGVGILIQNYVGSEDEMRLGDNEKPLYDKAYFNVAHSGEVAMLTTADSEVGCDVELIKDNNAMRIANRFFFNEEYQMLVDEENDEKRRGLFFRLWTLKESFLKVTGEGLRIPLNSFSVNPLADPPAITQTYSPSSFYLKEYEIKDYRLAVCTEGDNDFADGIIIVDA